MTILMQSPCPEDDFKLLKLSKSLFLWQQQLNSNVFMYANRRFYRLFIENRNEADVGVNFARIKKL